MTADHTASSDGSDVGRVNNGPAPLTEALRWAMTVLALGIAVLMWAPWVRTGQATRSSFEAFRALQILGLDQLTPLRVVWWLLPVLLAAVALVAGVGRMVSAAVGLAVLASVVGFAAAGMWVSDTSVWGSQVSLMGSTVGIAVSSTVLVRRFLTRIEKAPAPEGSRLRR